MIVLNIAEWIANLFILGIAALIWVVALFGFAMMINIAVEAARKTRSEQWVK